MTPDETHGQAPARAWAGRAGSRESAGSDPESGARRYRLPPTDGRRDLNHASPREVRGNSCIQRPHEPALLMGYDLQQRLDAFVGGECNLDVFVQELSVLCDAKPDSAWDVLSLVDQYYRRGRLSPDVFRTIKSRVERHVLGVPDPESVREPPNGHLATESRVDAAGSGAIAVVATPEQAPSLAGPPREVRAPRIEPPNAPSAADRGRNRLAIFAGFGRHPRSALANFKRKAGDWRRQAGVYGERLTSIEWGRFARRHINGEFARPSVAAVVLAIVLLGIESSRAPQDLPKQQDRVNVISRATAAVATPPIADPGEISLSAERYVVSPGHARAEIEVHRTGGVKGDVSFVWWTQRSLGARPARDYVSRTPTTALLLDGVDTLHLSVPILANPARKHTEFFYVEIGQPGGGASLGSIRRAAVFIMRPDHGTVLPERADTRRATTSAPHAGATPGLN